MPADQRLRRKSDFDAVFREGVRASGGVMSLRARLRSGADGSTVGRSDHPDGGPCRFGFAVSARLGGAVQRNRIRRRLRESARRLNAQGECEGLDVVVIARAGAVEAEFAELDDTLRGLLRRTQGRLGRGQRAGRQLGRKPGQKTGQKTDGEIGGDVGRGGS